MIVEEEIKSFASAAKNYLSSNLSVIPIREDKRPFLYSSPDGLLQWNAFRKCRMTVKQVDELFNGAPAIGIVCGKVDDIPVPGIEAIDIDCKYDLTGTLYQDLTEMIEDHLPGLLNRLTIIRTRSGGYHVLYRCNTIEGNKKLANRETTEDEKSKHPAEKIKVLIETRGNGGFIVVCPSPGYHYVNGDYFHIHEISEEEREIILAICRSFNQVNKTVQSSGSSAPAHTGTDETPWKLYNENADVIGLLSKHGFTVVHTSGERLIIKRQGADSASSGNYHTGHKKLKVFSTSTQFDPDHAYSPVEIYSLLDLGMDHNQIDWKRLAQELKSIGYGNSSSQRPTAESYKLNGEGSYQSSVKKVTNYDSRQKEEEKKTPVINLEELRITSASNIIEPPPIISIQEGTISTAGNVTVITGQAKSGKTAVLCAIIAASLLQSYKDIDTLGLTIALNELGKLVLHIDSEQAVHNHFRLIKNTLRRADISEDPLFLKSYNFRQLKMKERLTAMKQALELGANEFNGVHIIIVDGIADFLSSVNDEVEANAVLWEFEQLAIKYDCPIITVLHFNPGSDIKGRGHIGSQLERKCESALRVSIKGDLSTIEAAQLRSAGKFNPIEFSFNSGLGMHSILGIKDPASARNKLSKARFEMIKAFLAKGPKRRIDLVNDFMNAEGIKDRSAQSRVTELLNNGIIEYNNEKTEIHLSAIVQT